MRKGVCWNADAIMERANADMERAKKRAEEAKRAREEHLKNKSNTEKKSNHHFIGRDADVLSQLYYENTKSLTSTATVLSAECTAGVGDDEIDFIYDCAADIGLAAESEIGVNHRRTATILEGAVPGAAVNVSTKLDFLHGLGTALVVGNRNIISDWEITPSFDMQRVGDHEIHLKSKDTGLTWKFFRDPKRYKDLKFHYTINREQYQVMSFYQPRTTRTTVLTPREEKLIDDARDVHSRLGHPEDQVLTEIIRANPEDVGCTLDGLRLW